MKEKKSKDANVLCLYFVYKAEILKMQNHPVLKMDNLFQVPDGAGDNKALYEESKYALYHADELRMDFYLKMMKLLTRRGDCIFNVFGGSKPMFAALVSNLLPFLTTGPNHTSFYNVHRSALIVSNTCVFLGDCADVWSEHLLLRRGHGRPLLQEHESSSAEDGPTRLDSRGLHGGDC